MHQTKVILLIVTTILATSLPAAAQSQPTSTDLIGVGTTLLNNLLNPPSRSAEIAADAEVKKAKIAAEAEITKEKLRIEASKSDKVTPLLTQWGVTRVNCAPGLVFINGIGDDTVCIQPMAAMKAGSYTYDSTKQQLIRNNGNTSATNNNVQTDRTTTNTNSVQTERTITNNNNGQTIRTTQSTKISTPRQGF